MKLRTKPLTPALEEILQGLGENIRLARLRRRITTPMLAERAGINRLTLRRVERGEASVSMGIYARVLFCLGLEKDLAQLGRDDEMGRRLQDAGLKPTRYRAPKRKKQ